MRLADLVIEQRDKQVLMHARPHLYAGEQVLEWARARQPEQRRQGYVFLTPHKLLVVWSGRADGHGAIAWRDVDSWGVNCDAQGGPILGVESPKGRVLLQIPVSGHGRARRVTSFLRRLAHLAPRPRRRFAGDGRAVYVTDPTMQVTAARRTARDHTQRAVVTLLGLLMMAIGAVITPIPGPWSLPLVITGLAVLAREYDWAHDVLEWTKHKTRAARERLRARRAGG